MPTASWHGTDYDIQVENQLPKIGHFYNSQIPWYLAKQSGLASTQLSRACKTWLAEARYLCLNSSENNSLFKDQCFFMNFFSKNVN